MTRHRTYRAIIRLYPKEFRHQYGDDLLQAHDDLVAAHGRTRAWTRTGLDVAITVPRYRLETIMTTRQSDAALHAVIAAFIAVGAFVTLGGGTVLGAAILLVGAILAIAQRSRLTRSLHTPGPGHRRRRLRTAAVLGGICVVTLAVFIVDIGGDDHWGGRAVVYITICNVAFIAAAVYLVAGLFTRRSAGTAAPLVNH